MGQERRRDKFSIHRHGVEYYSRDDQEQARCHWKVGAVAYRRRSLCLAFDSWPIQAGLRRNYHEYKALRHREPSMLRKWQVEVLWLPRSTPQTNEGNWERSVLWRAGEEDGAGRRARHQCWEFRTIIGPNKGGEWDREDQKNHSRLPGKITAGHHSGRPDLRRAVRKRYRRRHLEERRRQKWQE